METNPTKVLVISAVTESVSEAARVEDPITRLLTTIRDPTPNKSKGSKSTVKDDDTKAREN